MAPKDPLIGEKLGDYEILDLLGQGGMARVYRGYDPVLDRYAAVKVVEPRLLASQDEADYRERFLREARSIARLDHPRVVRVYQFGQSDDHALYYMAMSFINGRDLREILQELNKRRKRLSFPHMLRILRDIASALDYAHRQNVIHRDVKPSNIVVTADGHAVLTDFGLALDVDEGTIGNSFGSVHYIAPEQAVSSSQAVPQSDLYSLGVVLFEMLTGQVPFEDTSAMSIALKHISDPPPNPSGLNPEVSAELDAVVLKALSKRPDDRFLTGIEMIRAVEQAFIASESSDTQPLQAKSSDSISAATTAEFRRVIPTSPEEVASGPEKAPTLSSAPVLQPAAATTTQDNVPTFISGPKLREKIRKAVEDSQPRHEEPYPVDSGNQQSIEPAALVGGVQPEQATAVPTLRHWNRRFIYAGITTVLLVLALLFAIRRLDSDDGDSSLPVVSRTETAVAQGFSPPATNAASVTSTALPTHTVTSSATRVTPSPTAVPAEDTATATATRRPARSRTGTPTLMASPTPVDTTVPSEPTIAATDRGLAPMQAEEGLTDVLLRYDGRTLVLLNQSDQAVDVSDLIFVRLNANGTDDTLFRTREWSVEDVFGLNEGDCLQVWTMDFLAFEANEPPADICESRRATRQTARAFWTTTQDKEFFEVRLFGDVLARCPVRSREAGLEPVDTSIAECRVDLPDE